MQIIVLSSACSVSGGARQALYLADGLKKRGLPVRFVCPPACALSEAAENLNLPYTALPDKFFEAERVLRALLLPDGPTVIHAFHNKGVKWAAYMGTLWQLKKLPVACVAHRGVTARPGNPLPYLLPGIRAFLVNSKACARTLPLLWRKKRCFVVNNSIPDDRLIPHISKEEMRERLGIAPEHLIVGTICNNNPAKGAGALIRAFAAAQPKLPPATLLLVGVSSERWLPLCEEHGVAGPVRLIPHTPDIADYLQCLDLMCFPSSFIESQPNVIIEAMCLGVPVIAGAVGGVPELLPPECLFDPADEKVIAEKLLYFMSRPDERQRLSAEGLAKKHTFSLEFRLDTLLAHYRRCLEEQKLLPA